MTVVVLGDAHPGRSIPSRDASVVGKSNTVQGRVVDSKLVWSRPTNEPGVVDKGSAIVAGRPIAGISFPSGEIAANVQFVVVFDHVLDNRTEPGDFSPLGDAAVDFQYKEATKE